LEENLKVEQKKSKIFARKLIALFLAAILAVSAFTGVMTVFANSSLRYHDEDLAANFLAWAETTDDQTAEALLDYADLYLPQIMEGLDLGDIKPRGSTHIDFSYDLSVAKISINGYADSVDGVLDLIYHAQKDIIEMKVAGIGVLGLLGGDVKNVSLKAIYDLNRVDYGVVSKSGVAYRSGNDAKEIIITLAELIYDLSNDWSGSNIVNQFIKGEFDLGNIISNFVDLWGLLKDPLNMWDGYQTNLVYNIVANLIWDNTTWYTDEQITAFKEGSNGFINKGKDQTVWDFDNELFGKLTSELIQQINIQVTYSNKVQKIELDKNNENYGQFVYDNDNNPVIVKDSSARRWFLINKYMKQDKTYAEAVALVNANEGAEDGFYCDPNLRYSMNADGTSDGNILLFTYGDETLNVDKTDTFAEIAFKALKIAWSTVLQPTVNLLKPGYEGNRNNSTVFDQEVSDFDNEFYSWVANNIGWETGDNWADNYSASNVNAWANAVYKNYTYKDGVEASVENFLDGVAQTFKFDRRRVSDPQNNWRDVDATKLFAELRYSPLADKYFNEQTGPVNLYFVQTGAPNINAFFDTAFEDYDSILQAANNALVAAVKDFFPNSNNIGIEDADGTVLNLNRPELATTMSTDSQTIAETLVGNAAKVFEYAANAVDANILGAFYAQSASRDPFQCNSISEANLEEAALPMLVSILNQWSMTDVIHDDDWDYCVDAEGVAVTALVEYLSYVLPDKDYSDLYRIENKTLVAGNKCDINNDGKYDLFNDAIMPMARDALGYVIQSVVPCYNKDGEEWNVYKTDPTKDSTTIFDILNSVLCYYGSTDTFDNTSGSGSSTIKGKGVAALLGCVDKNGKCTITFENTIWENLDIMINTLLPVVGSLQTGTFGDCDSEDLIYNKIILGLLDISRDGGTITNIIKQFADIVNSDPVSIAGADVSLYDYIVAPTINGILGAKYDGEGFTNVIPASHTYYDTDSSSNTKGESPFNALVHVDTLGGFEGIGVLSVLICNLVEAFGVDDYWSKSGDRWQGAMFAVKAVNNFIPSFVPQLSNMTFGPVTANVNTTSYSGVAINANISDYLTIKNTAMGLNRFYRPDNNSAVEREQRYFSEVKSAVIYDVTMGYDDPATNLRFEGAASDDVYYPGSKGILSPGETLKVPLLGNTPGSAGTYVYKVAVTYNMFEAELNGDSKPSAPTNPDDYLFSSDITTYAYMTITVGGSWQSVVYPDSRADKDGDTITKYKFATGIGKNNLSGVNTAGAVNGSGYNTVVGSTAGAQNNNMVISVPQNMVIPSENPSVASLYSIRARNNATQTNATRSYSGAVAFISEGTEYYAVNGTTVAGELSTMKNNTTYNMAYALIDEDGNLIKNNFYDYRVKDATTGEWGAWQRGFSSSEMSTLTGENGAIHDAFSDNRVEQRTHITYTFAEALEAGIVKGVQRTQKADGSYTYENVFVAPSVTLVSDTKDGITWAAPFDGFYFQNHGASVAKGGESFDKLLQYDSTGVTPSRDPYTMNLYFVADAGNPMYVTMNVYIADQSDLYNVTSATNEQITKMASYRPSDFLDFDETTGVSENYNAIIDAMTDALKLASTPLSVENAMKISSVKIGAANTSQTTSTTGDKAFKPATASEIPDAVLAVAYEKDDVYYINKECTAPIYSNVELTDADVTDGADATGQAVTKVGDKYYLANELSYESEWDTTTYWTDGEIEGTKEGAPYYGVVKDADHITKWGEDTVYNQIQFVYRDANGEKVNSDEDWVVKFASVDTIIKPNDGNEYRGAYQQGVDTINYYNSIFSKILKTVGAQSIAEEVTAVRSVDSNSVNYDVASYERMVKIAREAESLIWYEDAVDSEGKPVYNEDGSRKQVPVTDKASMEIEIAVREFKKYLGRSNPRGYIGDKLEAEISAHHAIGGTYENFTATKTGEQVRFEYSTKAADEEDNVDVYTVTVADGTNIGFGTRDADGTLVNEDASGNKAWTDASWNAYVNALGAAVETAAGQEARVSEVYTAKSHLVMAENNLQPYTGEEGEDTSKFTVSGKITIAKNSQGSAGEYGIGGIEIYMGDQLVGTSAEDGTFEIKVPKGEPVGLTLKGESTVERSITINGDADVTDINIPVVVVDYLKDGIIDYRDVKKFVNYIDEPEAYNVYGDLLKDGLVDYRDVKIFVNFIDVPVEYAPWSQTDTTYILN
jgi:hypothetical protein